MQPSDSRVLGRGGFLPPYRQPFHVASFLASISSPNLLGQYLQNRSIFDNRTDVKLRWMVANGRVSEARSILVRHHAGGDENSALVLFEITEMERAIQLDREAEAKTPWLTLFSTAAYRKRSLIAMTLGFFSQWNGIGSVF
jgi:hypothetical protein